MRAVLARLGARIARGDQGDGLAAVRELEMRRASRPSRARSVGRFDRDARQPRERHPVVAAVDHGLEHRPEAQSASAIHSNGRSSIVPRGRGRGVERLRAQRGRLLLLAAPAQQQRFDEQGEPLLRLAEHHAASVCRSKTFARSTSQRSASRYICAMASARRIEMRRDIELRRARAPIGRARRAAGTGTSAASRRRACRAPRSCRRLERLRGIAGAKTLFRAAGCSHRASFVRSSSCRISDGSDFRFERHAAALLPVGALRHVFDRDLLEREAQCSISPGARRSFG